MKKLIIFILLLFITTTAYPQTAGMVGKGRTDYSQDASVWGVWIMNDGAETTDSSGNSHTLTPVNSPTETSAKYGDGYDLNQGDDEYLHSGEQAISGVTALTCMLWVNFDGTGSHQGLITHRDNSGGWDDVGFYLQKSDDDKLYLYISDGAAGYAGTSTSTISKDTWYHFAGVWDGTEVKIYWNGTWEDGTSEAFSGTMNTASDMWFLIGTGISSTFSQYELDGTVDEVGVWTRTFTDKEIQECMNYGITGDQ